MSQGEVIRRVQIIQMSLLLPSPGTASIINSHNGLFNTYCFPGTLIIFNPFNNCKVDVVTPISLEGIEAWEVHQIAPGHIADKIETRMSCSHGLYAPYFYRTGTQLVIVGCNIWNWVSVSWNLQYYEKSVINAYNGTAFFFCIVEYIFQK